MAGSIDNLNFEIILKDDEFGKRVQENIKLAKELNVSLTALLDLQSKVKATGVKTPNATQQPVTPLRQQSSSVPQLPSLG